jgi:hypothetical protein
VTRHPRNLTGRKSLDRVAADHRVVEVRHEGSDGYWVDLADGWAREGCISLRADTVKDLIQQLKGVEMVMSARVHRGGKDYWQELVFLAEWHRPGIVPKAKPVRVARRPDRVWTLFRDEDPLKPPALPFHPLHRVNAFAEDYVHDWDWRNGVFDFYSRVADRPVWVLLEYEVEAR